MPPPHRGVTSEWPLRGVTPPLKMAPFITSSEGLSFSEISAQFRAIKSNSDLKSNHSEVRERRFQVPSAVPGVGTALDSKAKWNAHPLKTAGKSNDQWRSAVTMSSATSSKQSKGKKEREYKRIYPDRLLNPAKLKRHHSLRPCEQQGQQHIFNFCLCAPAARIWNEEKWAASADLMWFFFFIYLFLLLLLLWWQHARPSGCSAIERGRMELKFFARAVDIHPEQ